MKTRTKLVRRVVSSSDVREYEETFNKVAEELASKSPTIKDIFENGTLSTVFTYEITKQIPECAKDKLELEGLRFTCGECPYLEDDGDKRRRWFPCPYSDLGQVHVYSEACDKFYRDYMRGDIKPRGEI